MNCAYIRLSEEDINKSKDFSESIINQIELIEEYARRNNIHIDKKYIDEGYSGINFCRPAFEKMLKEIEQNNIETIITKDFSRLGREFIETGFYITRFFPEHSIRYIAINEDYDSINKNNDAKEMMVGIKGIINDRYIKDTSRKIKAVKKQKSEDGYYMGFIAPYGYKKIRLPDGKITLKEDDNVSNIVRLIFQKIIEGMSRKDIAELLNSLNIPSPMQYMEMTKSRGKNYYDKWTAGIIYRIIRNRTYTGNTYKRKSTKEDYRQKKRDYIRIRDREIIPNTHPVIINEETFEKANSMLRTNTKINRLKDYKGNLDGLVRCGECGKIMNVSGRQKESERIVYHFYCTDGRNKHKECTNTKAIFTNKLEDIVYKYLSVAIKNITEEKIIEESIEKMIGLKKVILTFCVYLIGVGGMGNVWASNKTIRDFHEFELWHKLLQYGLSPSGEWAMWRIQAAEKTDTLFVRHIASGKEYKYKNTSAPEFSKDSHWIVFSEPAGENAAAGIAYQVKLVCLANGEEQIFRVLLLPMIVNI